MAIAKMRFKIPFHFIRGHTQGGGQGLGQAGDSIRIRSRWNTPVAFQKLLSDQPPKEVPVPVALKFLGIFLAEDTAAFSLQEVFQVLTYTAAILVHSPAQVPRTYGRCSCEGVPLPVKTPVIGEDLDSPFGGALPNLGAHIRGKKVEAVGDL
jgi:hypothetical protein